MIGQTEIVNQVDSWIRNGNVPRFIIIGGARKCGKTFLAKHIARKMKAYLIECEPTVDAVREAVKNCYKCAGTTVYLFDDADRMSTAAKNAMLKITEEPPRQAHFILTVRDFQNILETLRSRATNIMMSPYSKEQLDAFYHDETNKKHPLIREICDVPGLMLEMEKIDIVELLDFCNTIIDNIQQVTGVNAFKIVQRIRLKEDGPGYDPELFFYCMKYAITERIMEMREIKDIDHPKTREELKTLGNMLNATCKYHHEFNTTGIKKDATLDMWVLEMREC